MTCSSALISRPPLSPRHSLRRKVARRARRAYCRFLCGLMWTSRGPWPGAVVSHGQGRGTADEVLRPRAAERHCVLARMVARHRGLPRTATRYCVLAWMVTMSFHSCESRRRRYQRMRRSLPLLRGEMRRSLPLLRGEGDLCPLLRISSSSTRRSGR